MKDLKERLTAGSVENKTTGCIEWKRYINASGYGAMWFNGKSATSHRVAWTERYGSIPYGMQVLHKCDNRKCINPDHLFLGTNSDNVADKVSKDRQFRPDAKGEKNNMAKLTDEKVIAIRKLSKEGLSNRRIAKEFGVSIMTISFIRNFKTWTHVEANNAIRN